jgi:hypothetical protein
MTLYRLLNSCLLSAAITCLASCKAGSTDFHHSGDFGADLASGLHGASRMGVGSEYQPRTQAHQHHPGTPPVKHVNVYHPPAPPTPVYRTHNEAAAARQAALTKQAALQQAAARQHAAQQVAAQKQAAARHPPVVATPASKGVWVPPYTCPITGKRIAGHWKKN